MRACRSHLLALVRSGRRIAPAPPPLPPHGPQLLGPGSSAKKENFSLGQCCCSWPWLGRQRGQIIGRNADTLPPFHLAFHFARAVRAGLVRGQKPRGEGEDEGRKEGGRKALPPAAIPEAKRGIETDRQRNTQPMPVELKSK